VARQVQLSAAKNSDFCGFAAALLLKDMVKGINLGISKAK